MTHVDLIIEKRDDIKATCNKYGATTVRVFGSCARGDHKATSDIDVLVQVPKTLTGFEYFGALCDLESDLESLLGVPVDLVDEASLNPKWRDRILQEAVPL